MLKSIKIPEKAYKLARNLSEKLEKGKELKGVYNVSISTAVSYAIEKANEDIDKKNAFRKAAGSWSDINTDKLIKEIYDGRRKGSKNMNASFD